RAPLFQIPFSVPSRLKSSVLLLTLQFYYCISRINFKTSSFIQFLEINMLKCCRTAVKSMYSGLDIMLSKAIQKISRNYILFRRVIAVSLVFVCSLNVVAYWMVHDAV